MSKSFDNSKRAIDALRAEAARGSVTAQSRLALLINLGAIVPKGDESAEKFWNKAAHQGDVPSKVNLGSVLEKRGDQTSLLEAKRLYSEAAAVGHLYAKQKLVNLEKRYSAQPVIIKQKVLVVDDFPAARRDLKKFFERYDFEVIEAIHGRDGLEKLRQHPDVVMAFIKLAMPDVDGIRMTTAVRKIDIFTRLPIVMMHHNTAKDMILQARQAGVTSFLLKPPPEEELIRAIERFAPNASLKRTG